MGCPHMVTITFQTNWSFRYPEFRNHIGYSRQLKLQVDISLYPIIPQKTHDIPSKCHIDPYNVRPPSYKLVYKPQ